VRHQDQNLSSPNCRRSENSEEGIKCGFLRNGTFTSKGEENDLDSFNGARNFMGYRLRHGIVRSGDPFVVGRGSNCGCSKTHKPVENAVESDEQLLQMEV
jgi:hypothetical protein